MTDKISSHKAKSIKERSTFQEVSEGSKSEA